MGHRRYSTHADLAAFEPRKPSVPWYIFAGILLLGASIWVPYLSAVRTARVESRADEIAGLLLQATKGQIGAIGPDELQNVLARFFALAEREQVLVGDLEVHDSPLSGTLVSLQNKHYLFYLAASVPDADAIVSRDSTPSFETMAWPMRGPWPRPQRLLPERQRPARLHAQPHGWLPGHGRSSSTIECPPTHELDVRGFPLVPRPARRTLDWS